MNTNKLFHNQDETMEHIMLFAPMPVLQAIQDSFTESILADMQEEDAEIFAESVPIHKSGKSRKSRRAIRIDRNRRKKGSDRAHGKKRPMSRKNRVRAEDDRAQMSRPIGMWKGDYVFRPFQRSNRHNNYVSPEQERLNLLKVGAQRVSVQEVNWAKAVVQNAAEEGQEWAIYDALADSLDYCPAAEKEVALLTVILLSLWTEQFDGYVRCDLPATRDCLDSINHNDWYRWAIKQEVPMVVEPWTPNV